MVKRAPSGAGVKALPLARQAVPLPPIPPSRMGRPRRPSALGDSRREDASPGVSSGTRPAAPGSSETLGFRIPDPPSPPARRASAAAGAAPQEPPPRTVLLARAGGGGRGDGTLVSAELPPDPPAAALRWSRLDCQKGASRLRAEDPSAFTSP